MATRNPKAKQDNEATETVRMSAAELRAAVNPDPLEDVLASLKFRRIIKSYTFHAGDVVMEVRKSAGIALAAILASRGE